MDTADWVDRWKSNRIGFHEGKPNALLLEYFSSLAVPDGGRVFLPLCGKTIDIHWLLACGYRVVGAELSELAITQLFAELGIEPSIAESGALQQFSGAGIDIFVGDIFELNPTQLGPVDAVFDRAAFVALPDDLRGWYADHVSDLAGGAPQLLITFGYDQSIMTGPPFSIADEEVHRRYGETYDVESLTVRDAPGGLRGVDATEQAWLLTQR